MAAITTPVVLSDAAIAFLEKDYEMKVRSLTDHYGRMWTRFNFFMVANTAVAIAAAGRIADGKPLADLIAFSTAGTLLTLCWYIFGAEDRYLVEAYRKEIRRVGEYVQAALGLTRELQKLDPTGEFVTIADITKEPVAQAVYQWRIEIISTTKLVAWFPLLLFLCWSVGLIAGLTY